MEVCPLDLQRRAPTGSIARSWHDSCSSIQGEEMGTAKSKASLLDSVRSRFVASPIRPLADLLPRGSSRCSPCQSVLPTGLLVSNRPHSCSPSRRTYGSADFLPCLSSICSPSGLLCLSGCLDWCPVRGGWPRAGKQNDEAPVPRRTNCPRSPGLKAPGCTIRSAAHRVRAWHDDLGDSPCYDLVDT